MDTNCYWGQCVPEKCQHIGRKCACAPTLFPDRDQVAAAIGAADARVQALAKRYVAAQAVGENALKDLRRLLRIEQIARAGVRIDVPPIDLGGSWKQIREEAERQLSGISGDLRRLSTELDADRAKIKKQLTVVRFAFADQQKIIGELALVDVEVFRKSLTIPYPAPKGLDCKCELTKVLRLQPIGQRILRDIDEAGRLNVNVSTPDLVRSIVDIGGNIFGAIVSAFTTFGSMGIVWWEAVDAVLDFVAVVNGFLSLTSLFNTASNENTRFIELKKRILLDSLQYYRIEKTQTCNDTPRRLKPVVKTPMTVDPPEPLPDGGGGPGGVPKKVVKKTVQRF